MDQEKYLSIKTPLVYTTQELRKRAEEIHRKKILQSNETITDFSSIDVQSVLHELHIHQIELETQNEELRRIRNELETVQKHYFDLYHLAPVGYFTMSKSGLIQQINLTATILLGISKEKFVKQSFIRFIRKEERDIFYFLNKQLFEIGGPQKCELRIQRKDKTQFWASLTATVDLSAEKEPEIRIVLIDVSERRQAQIELQTSNVELKTAKKNLEAANAILLKTREQLSTFIQHAPVCIAMFDLHMNYLAVSDSWLKTYGNGETNIVGKNCYAIHPDITLKWKHLHQLGLAGATLKNSEDGWDRADGSVHWVSWALQPWWNENGTIGGIIISAEDITERKKQEVKLIENERRLYGLIAHQQHIKEEERIRIAREIHDELGSALTGVRANLSMVMHEDKIAGNAPDPHLVNARILLDDAVNTVKKVITELRPSVLDQLGIWAALEWYAEQVEARTKIRCDVEIDHQAQGITLDRERSTAIFRILQESLTNVMRHAQASQVEIHVTANHGLIQMTVEDNGTGIDIAPIPDHPSWGIVGMIERARFLGGDLEITNTSHGTLVKLQLPLERKP